VKSKRSEKHMLDYSFVSYYYSWRLNHNLCNSVIDRVSAASA